MTTSTSTVAHGSRPRLRTVAILAICVAVAIAVNALIAAVAVAAGASATYGPLTLPAYATFSILGILAGWIGWTLVARHSRRPSRTLALLVPIITVISLVPDLLLLAFRFIPGTTTPAAIGLMAMHLAVVALAVPAYRLASR